MTDDALVGYTGFVGSNISNQRHFSALFNRANIEEIRGRSYRRMVVSAAPATMWWANAHPDEDRANLRALADHISDVRAEELVLVSTIAVYDDAAAGHTEAAARFEQNKAYGRNRRELERMLTAMPGACHILRLPALFGPGLKKNFVFDLCNPAPSFIAPERFGSLIQETGAAELLQRHYAFDEGAGMWSLNRSLLEASGEGGILTSVLERAGFTSLAFTNSASHFQYYDVGRLADDIDRVVAAGLDVVNICSEPLSAAQVALELTGRVFDNPVPPVVSEDMRTVHAALLGGTAPYLYDRAATLCALKDFFSRASER